MKKFHCLVVMGLALLGASVVAKAQVFIKPTGSKAIPVRVQKLRAEVEIIGAIAITRWTMDIQMENVGFGGWRNEGAVCDFICARPSDAKVTSFGAGELNGRVVERAVAAPRVAFRAAKDDPLLRSGLNANNSFRSTIYPMGSWDQVVVSGTWVQSLASNRTGATYRLPLLGLRGATTRLKELSVKITARDGVPPTFTNNYRLPLKTQGGARVLTLSQKNYRVLRDLTLTFKPAKSRPSLATLLSSAAKPGEAHFAFAFVAPRSLKNLAVEGAGLTDTTFSAKSVRAGEVVLATGSYSGVPQSLSAKFSADGLPPVSLVPTQNEVAHSLWATQKINALGNKTNSNRAQITALSKRYSVISPFTSWLAVAEDDLRIYRRALVSSQLDPLVREYWLRLGDGQAQAARVVQLKKAVTQISLANGLNVEDELYARLGSATNYAAWKGWYYGRQPKTRPEKRYATLIKAYEKYMQGMNFKGKAYGDPPRLYFETGLYELRGKIMGEYRKPHPNFAQLDEWERRFAQIYGSSDLDPRLSFWRARLTAQSLEEQTTAAQQAGDTAKLTQLQQARNVNSRHAYFVNGIGDPPIYVSAPADARQVVAIMPDGQVKTLDYNRTEKRWEGNYDVPVGTRDGDYKIQILIVNADGSRRRYAMPFRVDTKAPQGKGRVELASSKSPATGLPPTLRLEVEHSGDVAVVTALLPWGEKVALLPSTVRATTFFGAIPVPASYVGKSIKVTYILIDRAHNTTAIEAESITSAPAHNEPLASP